MSYWPEEETLSLGTLRLGWRRASGNHVIRSHLLHDRVHRFLNVFKKRLRIDADPQCENHQRHHVGPLAAFKIRQVFVLGIRDVPEEHALVQPEKITGIEK